MKSKCEISELELCLDEIDDLIQKSAWAITWKVK